jgi:hypothetical protein
MGELKVHASGKVDGIEAEKINDLKTRIYEADSILNKAFIDWDLETIKKYYTDDAIIDQEGLPTVYGKNAFLSQLKKDRNKGLRFLSFGNDILELWTDAENIYVLETYTYSLLLEYVPIKLSGYGNSLTIWQEQPDGSLIIKYSILNIESSAPELTNNEE